LGLGLGIVPRGDPIENLHGDLPGPPFLASSAVLFDTEVSGEAQRPGDQGNVSPKPMEIAVKLEKDLLGQVFRFGRSPGELKSQVVDLPTVEVDEPIPGCGLPFRSPLGQL